MTVVIINDNAHVNGGATKIAILNARDLAERGHDVVFFCAVMPVGPELENHPRITVVCTEQQEILTDPNRARAFTQGLWNRKAQKLAEQLFAALDPKDTVVHLHLWAKALSSSAARAAICGGFPVICTLHDFLLACPTGTLYLHPQSKICSLEPMGFGCIACNCDTRSYPQKLWRVGRQVIQKGFGLLPGGILHYVAHSQLAADIMRPHLPSRAVIHHLPPFIESKKQPAASVGDYDTFLYLGRLVREKGVRLLAQAAKAEKVPLTFVGSGELAGEVSQVNPEASITGWVTHEQSVEYLRTSRALVFPSLWFETLGLVVLEAASHGIPSIVSDRSAACESVIDGVTGLHFKHGDEEDLRLKIRRLRDPDFAAQLGYAAYQQFWAGPYASREAHMQCLENIYGLATASGDFQTRQFTTPAERMA